MMGNVKLFMAILLSIATMASGVEVISIDINNYGNDVAYIGEAAVSGATEWVVYYGGWGTPVGSPRSADLAEAKVHYPEADPPDPYPSSTYAEQVWLGDPGGHGYPGSGDTLLGDGFQSNTPSPTSLSTDPNIAFIGLDLFSGDQVGDDAYGGTFDMYVYGNSAGTFTLTNADPNGMVVIASGSVTGTTSGFVEGENYVVFSGVSIADPNSALLWYSNELNGIQLVSTKQTPKVINPDSVDPNDYTITISDWDVAFDTNGRPDETNYGFGSYYGPDFYPGSVGILDTGDAMEYDVSIDAAAQGQYNLTIFMDTTYGATTLNFFLDGIPIGSLTGSAIGPETVGPLSFNLFTGMHTLKWQSTGYQGANLGNIVLNYVGPIILNDCADVYTYGLQLGGDITGDCRVDISDLALIVAEWTNDYNPF